MTENKIEVPEGSAGQEQHWPGDKQLKPGQQECPPEDRGTREHETTIIPKVQ